MTRTSDERVHEVSRRLRARAEAVAAVVFLAPEAGDPPHGLSPADYYAGSRAASLGRAPGPVVAAVFGLLEPTGLAAAVERAWAAASPEELLASRLAMAETVIERSLGTAPDGIERTVDRLRAAVEAGRVEGHPLFAGLLAAPWPDSAFGRLWRACDLVREHRGGSHVNAFRAAGLDSAEVNVLSEVWRGRPLGSEASAVNGWPSDAVAAALDRLRERGLVAADGLALTDAGGAARERIEWATSMQERELVEAVGDHADELLAWMTPVAQALVEALPPPYWWDRAPVAS